MSNRRTMKQRKSTKTPPRRFDLSDADGPDARILDAIAVGKSYRAAAARHSTPAQVGYRLSVLRGAGLAVSPRIWREAFLSEEVRQMRKADRQFRYMEVLLSDARRTLGRIRTEQKGKRR